jgi:ATP-binding cassette subfamily C protein CydC
MRPILKDLTPIALVFWAGPRAKLIGGAVLAALTALSGLALLGLSGWFITATSIAGLTTATALAFDVFSPSAGIRFLALVRTAGRYGERLTTHDATLGVLSDLREKVFRGSAATREAEELRMRPATLLFRITQDIDALDSLYLRVILPTCVAVASAFVASIALGLVSLPLGLATLLFVILVGLGVPLICARISVSPIRRRTSTLENMRSLVIDLVSGQTELVMAGRTRAHCNAITDSDRELTNTDDMLNRIEAAFGAAISIAGSVLIAGALFVSASAARAGEIGAPLAALVTLVAIAALEPFSSLRRGAIELGRTLIAARRIAPRLTEFVTPPMQVPVESMAAQISHITACHTGTRAPSIVDISLEIFKGERVALIGPSGAGKSTLLSVISGDLAPLQGRMQSVPSTLLTQRTELFADTLRDNLLLAEPRADDDALAEALSSAGLSACLRNLPLGLDTRLGEGGMGLSGGEARRLALARLFLRDSPLWLLDEPTEGLDERTGRDVIRRLAAKTKCRTLIIATHIRREAEIADRLITMHHGRIITTVSRGTPEFETALDALRQD